MKKILTLLLILTGSSLVFSQSKYMIYFKDKGVSQNVKLMKSSALFEAAAKALTPRAIERRKKVMGDNYITYEDLPIDVNYINQVESYGIKLINKLNWFNAVSCYLDSEQISEVLKIPFVQKVEQVKTLISREPVEQNTKDIQNIRKLSKIHSLDYGLSYTQYALSGIPAVHDLGIDCSNVIIGILDTGFRWKVTPSISTRTVLAEHDYVQNDGNTANEGNDRFDQDNHGTAIFSIIGGYDPGNIIGPAYGASFILAKTEYVPSETHTEEDNYAAALQWMENQGVDITTSSLGYSIFDSGQTSYTYSDMNGNTTIVAKAANLAFERGVSTFTAAGNEGSSSWHYITSPADAFNIIAVGAVNSNKIIASFSSVGPTYDGRIKPDVSAMGVAVVGADAGTDGYFLSSGTSDATPIAAGVGALLKSAYPFLTNVQMRDILLKTADNASSPDNEIGYGIISAKDAVAYPNLSLENNLYKIHKVFFDSIGVNSSSVKLNYKIGNIIYTPVSMNFDGSFRYDFQLPSSSTGDSVKFFFQYTNSKGLTVTDPVTGVYEFLYGDMSINKNLKDNFNSIDITKYELEQNYPNPFNRNTTFYIKSVKDADAQVLVYNILGQKVKTIYNGSVPAGVQRFTWNGLNDNGYLTASGVYIYVLIIDGKILAKKMMYIKNF